MKQILVGTRNAAKARAVQAALESLPMEMLTPEDLNISLGLREDGLTTEENAESKARAYFAECGIPTLAIDGGLRIERLPEEKQPGVFVRRIAGRDREATDNEVLDYYVGEMEKLGGESACTWKGSIALVTSTGKLVCESYSFGALMTSRPKGGVPAGSPLDAVTIDPETGRYYTELRWQERPDVGWIREFLTRHMAEI